MRTSLVLVLALTTLGTAACSGSLGGDDASSEQSSALRGDPMLPLPLPPTANPVPVGKIEKPPARTPPVPPPPASLYGTITGYAGLPGSFGHSDGPIQTTFGHPTWVASTPTGLTWVVDLDDELDVYSDRYKSRLRLIRDTRGGQGGPHLQTILTQTDYTIDVNGIGGMAVDPVSGDLFVTQGRYGHNIQKVTTAGVVSQVAGFASWQGSYGALPAAYFNDSPLDSLGNAHPFNARFNTPAGIARDAQGNLYVADTNNHAIRMITPAGVVSTVAHDTSASPISPSALAFDAHDGSLYTTSGHAVYRVASGQMSLYAGNPTTAGNQDSIAQLSYFNAPQGLAVDRSGNVYVADTGNVHIRKIVPADGSLFSFAMVTTISFQPYSNQITFDGYGGGDEATLQAPQGLSFWGDALVMSDSTRGTVRVLH